MMNKSLTKLLLTIMGAVLLIAYIWYRFIRERLPKDIPFHLTEYRCVILIYICSLYLFVIVMLILEFRTKNDTLSLIIDYIYKPLRVLDESIKQISLIAYYHEKVIKILSTKTINYSKIYYLFNIIPRLILVTVLSLDTFYFDHLEYLYKFILLGLIPFLYKYFIHSLKYAKELFILQLEPIVDQIQTDYKDNLNDGDYSFLDLREFIKIQTDSIYYNNHKYYSSPIPTSSSLALFQNQEVTAAQMQAEHYRLLDIIVPISVHLEYFDGKHNYNNIIKNIKVAIFGSYLICWSYILYVSIHTLAMDAFEWLWIIQVQENPFL